MPSFSYSDPSTKEMVYVFRVPTCRLVDMPKEDFVTLGKLLEALKQLVDPQQEPVFVTCCMCDCGGQQAPEQDPVDDRGRKFHYVAGTGWTCADHTPEEILMLNTNLQTSTEEQ